MASYATNVKATCPARATFGILVRILALSVAGLLGTCLAAAALSGDSSKQSVDELIQLLASPDYKKRETATTQLVERKDAGPALRKALKASDLEVAVRVASVLKKRDLRLAEDALPRLKKLINDGAIDQVVELLVRWPAGHDETACWKEM